MPERVTLVIFAVIAVCLGLSALLAVVRIIRGPSVLDRTVATEVLVSTIVCALGALTVFSHTSTTLPVLISLSLVGFLGAVAVARFMPQPHDDIGESFTGSMYRVGERGSRAVPAPGTGGAKRPRAAGQSPSRSVGSSEGRSQGQSQGRSEGSGRSAGPTSPGSAGPAGAS